MSNVGIAAIQKSHININIVLHKYAGFFEGVIQGYFRRPGISVKPSVSSPHAAAIVS